MLTSKSTTARSKYERALNCTIIIIKSSIEKLQKNLKYKLNLQL